jgi:hypothetical protein
MSSPSSVHYTISHHVYLWFISMLQNVSEALMFKIKYFPWIWIWNICKRFSRPIKARFNARITGVSTSCSLVQTFNDWNVTNTFYKFKILTTMFLMNQAFRNVQPSKFFAGFNLQQISVCIEISDYVPCSTIILLKFFLIYQLIYKWIVSKSILKFTLKLIIKQLRHVSVQSPSPGSALFELAKLTVVKIIN